MAKEPEVNDNIAHGQERQPNPRKLQGKALQVNENSAGDQKPARSPAHPRRQSGEKPNAQKLQGKALQMNDNSVEDK